MTYRPIPAYTPVFKSLYFSLKKSPQGVEALAKLRLASAAFIADSVSYSKPPAGDVPLEKLAEAATDALMIATCNPGEDIGSFLPQLAEYVTARTFEERKR